MIGLLFLLALPIDPGKPPGEPIWATPEEVAEMNRIKPAPGFSDVGGTHCRRGEQVIFSCDVSGRRRVSVCRDDRAVLYRFGPTGRPEIELGRSTPPVTRWFRSHFASEQRLRFANGAYSYLVYDKSTRRGDQSGVMVWRNGKELARHVCRGHGPMQVLFPPTFADMAEDTDPRYDSWSW